MSRTNEMEQTSNKISRIVKGSICHFLAEHPGIHDEPGFERDVTRSRSSLNKESKLKVSRNVFSSSYMQKI